MKNKALKIIITLILFSLCNPLVINFVDKKLLLLENQANYIPDNSSAFYFKPTVIDKGSGEYWLYGEDKKNYYYFSEYEDLVYYYISRDNTCKDFEPHNFKTWCNPIRMYHKEN